MTTRFVTTLNNDRSTFSDYPSPNRDERKIVTMGTQISTLLQTERLEMERRH